MIFSKTRNTSKQSSSLPTEYGAPFSPGNCNQQLHMNSFLYWFLGAERQGGGTREEKKYFCIWSLLTAIMLEDLSRSFSLNNVSHVTIIKAKAKQHAYFGKKQWRLSRPLFPLGFYAIVWNNILIIFLRQVYFIYKWYFQTPNTISGDQ